MENGQSSSHRYVFLFMPGTYDVDVPVGYSLKWLAWDTHQWHVVVAASQASPLLSVVVTRNLSLADHVRNSGEGYSSEGFVANLIVGDTQHFGVTRVSGSRIRCPCL